MFVDNFPRLFRTHSASECWLGVHCQHVCVCREFATSMCVGREFATSMCVGTVFAASMCVGTVFAASTCVGTVFAASTCVGREFICSSASVRRRRKRIMSTVLISGTIWSDALRDQRHLCCEIMIRRLKRPTPLMLWDNDQTP